MFKLRTVDTITSSLKKTIDDLLAHAVTKAEHVFYHQDKSAKHITESLIAQDEATRANAIASRLKALLEG